MRSAHVLGCEVVSVVQSAQSRDRDDLSANPATRDRRSITWRSLLQPKVRSIFVVIVDVFRHKALEMLFVE